MYSDVKRMGDNRARRPEPIAQIWIGVTRSLSRAGRARKTTEQADFLRKADKMPAYS